MKGAKPLKYIQSAQNPKVKQWKKLLTKKERDRTGLFIVEGHHLVEEAVKAQQAAELIVSEQRDLPPGLDFGDIPVTAVTEEIISMLAETETTQGIFAICHERKDDNITGKRYLLIDAVQDPGNLGTMIRTADAAGMDAVIVGKGSVDVYNPKVLRSAQGSHFYLPVVTGDLFAWTEKLKKSGITIYGTALENGSPHTDIETAENFALIVGNEGSGVSKELLAETDANLYIPIYGSSESLNVAVAAGILMYHLRK